MEEKHYIEWIEIIADGKAYRQFLNPGSGSGSHIHDRGCNRHRKRVL